MSPVAMHVIMRVSQPTERYHPCQEWQFWGGAVIAVLSKRGLMSFFKHQLNFVTSMLMQEEEAANPTALTPVDLTGPALLEPQLTPTVALRQYPCTY